MPGPQRVDHDDLAAIDVERTGGERERLDPLEVMQPGSVDQLISGDHADAEVLRDLEHVDGLSGTEVEIRPDALSFPLGIGQESPAQRHRAPSPMRRSSAACMSVSKLPKRSGTPGRRTDAARRCIASAGGSDRSQGSET